MGTKHTPGPWDILIRDCPVEPGETYTAISRVTHRDIPGRHTEQDVCHVSTWGGADDESRANARLIAAAPDLFALLEEISKKDPHVASSMEYVVAKAKAAIDKVRHNVGGEAPAPA